MSESGETQRALKRVREAFDRAATEADEMSERAKREVREAIDEVEEQVDRLRNRG